MHFSIRQRRCKRHGLARVAFAVALAVALAGGLSGVAAEPATPQPPTAGTSATANKSATANTPARASTSARANTFATSATAGATATAAPASRAAASRYTLAGNRLRAPAAPSTGDARDDPADAAVLPHLVGMAFARYPALRAQQLQQEAAQAGVAGARWQFFPTPVVSMERAAYGSSGSLERGDRQVLTVGLRQPIWTGGRLTTNLDRAQLRVHQSEAELESLRQQVALRVIQHWSDAVAAHEVVQALEQSRAMHERLRALVSRRAADGASPEADVQLARSRLESVDADLEAARARRDTALARLAVLVGQPVPESLLLDEPPPAPVAGEPASALRAAAREMSPDIARARVAAQLAERDIDSAQQAMLPEVYLRAERQYGNFNQRGAPPENRVFIGVSTAFTGGLSNLSAVDGARAQYRAALENVRTQQLTLDEQVTADLTLARATAQRKASLAQARRAAGDVSLSWERQFLAGRKQWQDLMNSAREQAQTDAQLAETIGAEQLTGWRLLVLTRGVNALFQP